MEKIGALIWDELVALPVPQAASELLGMLESLPRLDAGADILVASPRLVVTRRLLKLWRGLNDSKINGTIGQAEGSLELDPTQGKARFRIARSSLAKLLEGSERIARQNRWEWARGIWAGCGALYLPRSGYYMTMRLADSKLEPRVKRVYRSAGAEPRSRVKQGKTELTVRDQSQIVASLSKMGLVRSSLLLEEKAIMRSIKSKANKLVNCDEANIEKSLGAARLQLALVQEIESYGLWDELPPELGELARTRRENPSASLRELGQILARPVSKSTVEYRWKKLEALVRG